MKISQENGDATDEGPKAHELFSNLFFGLSKDYITFEWADYKTKKNQEAVFGPLTLDVGPKSLTNALQEFYDFAIDGYICPDVILIIAFK